MSRTKAFSLVIAVLVAIVFAACDDGPAAEPLRSGINGIVTIGPICPVETEASPCDDRPYQAKIIVEDEDGDQVATAESAEDGTFSVGLSPGSYTLVPQPPSPGAPPFAEEQEVVVEEGRYTAVAVAYDSGIR